MFKNSALLSALFFMSCATHKKAQAVNELPSCLETKIEAMSANPREGTPQSIKRYSYKGQTVYYMLAPCCDKYNIVFDSDCNILGFPDGGYTGKGDGKMPDFHKEATDGKIVWKKNSEENTF
jgi:hypothetical protein